jgi:site-specific recombinase XerD
MMDAIEHVPIVPAELVRIRRELGTAPRRGAPLVVDEPRQLCAALEPESRIGRRDRALLTIRFAAALRRSELVALDVEQACFTKDGLELLITKSNTDQEGVRSSACRSDPIARRAPCARSARGSTTR